MSCFKPCYKWNTFNTIEFKQSCINMVVLNLVISGIPSILVEMLKEIYRNIDSFKPCYKWNTFNTVVEYILELLHHKF